MDEMIQPRPSRIGRALTRLHTAAIDAVGSKPTDRIRFPLPEHVTKRLDFALDKQLLTYEDAALIKLDKNKALARYVLNAVVAAFFDNSYTRLFGRPILDKLGINTLPDADTGRWFTGQYTRQGMIVPVLEATLFTMINGVSNGIAHAFGQKSLPWWVPTDLPIEKVFGFEQGLHDLPRLARYGRQVLAYYGGNVRTQAEVIEAAAAVGIIIDPPPKK